MCVGVDFSSLVVRKAETTLLSKEGERQVHERGGGGGLQIAIQSLPIERPPIASPRALTRTPQSGHSAPHVQGGTGYFRG